MQVRIGVRDTAREVVFESAQTPQQVRAAVSEALAGDAGLLELEDEKGATVLIPTPALGLSRSAPRRRAASDSGRTDARRSRGPAPRHATPGGVVLFRCRYGIALL